MHHREKDHILTAVLGLPARAPCQRPPAPWLLCSGPPDPAGRVQVRVTLGARAGTAGRARGVGPALTPAPALAPASTVATSTSPSSTTSPSAWPSTPCSFSTSPPGSSCSPSSPSSSSSPSRPSSSSLSGRVGGLWGQGLEPRACPHPTSAPSSPRALRPGLSFPAGAQVRTTSPSARSHTALAAGEMASPHPAGLAPCGWRGQAETPRPGWGHSQTPPCRGGWPPDSEG